MIHLLPLARLRPPAQVEAGQALYTPVVLAVYDQFALGFSSRFAWRCPKTEMLALTIGTWAGSTSIIGVGTGFFLDRCHWPVARPQLTLLDGSRQNAHLERPRRSVRLESAPLEPAPRRSRTPPLPRSQVVI